MTQNDVKNIFEGATAEQIKAVLDINSADIGKAKQSAEALQTELDEAKNKITEYETEIDGLKGSMGEAEKLKEKIDKLQKTIDERKAADEEAEKAKALSERFNAACGKAEFLNDFTKAGVLEEFKAAIADKANEGKADKDIFEQITTGRDNLFVPEGGIPGVVSSTSGAGDSEIDNDVREIMGLPPLPNNN